MSEEMSSTPKDFIRQIVAGDLAAGRNGGRLVTRFPPEPNGHLHIGHAKSICLNFGIAAENPGGVCNLRFDDTNPLKEETAYIEAIQADVRWLGFDWGERLFYASGCFERFHELAVGLVQAGDAYVCGLTAEEMRAHRGTLTEPGRDSPGRGRTVAENLALFEEMRAGVHPDGAYTLRARIDMAAPNINLRDPALYRIRRAHHHQTGDRWCIYPTYDFAHCISDALEGITHSLCTLEFEDHRPLYDWILDRLAPELGCHPRQIEFSRLALEHTVMSKRKLNALVTSGAVSGWDDPRMPTLAGLRRRGYTPASIRDFCSRIGISKAPNNIEMALLENCLREDLEANAPRAMAVLNPLKVVITTFPEGETLEITAPNHSQDDSLGSRVVPFTREIVIERDDFMVEASKQFKRLVTGGEVRLRHAFVIRCDAVIRDPESGEIVELHASHDPATLNAAPEGRKVKGVIHWVSAARALRTEVRLYDRLFNTPRPDDTWDDGNIAASLNPDSLTTLSGCCLEPSLAAAGGGDRFQFERLGYFCVDGPSSAPGRPVFNRTVTLRDTWAKIQQRQGG